MAYHAWQQASWQAVTEHARPGALQYEAGSSVFGYNILGERRANALPHSMLRKSKRILAGHQ